MADDRSRNATHGIVFFVNARVRKLCHVFPHVYVEIFSVVLNMTCHEQFTVSLQAYGRTIRLLGCRRMAYRQAWCRSM